MTKLETMLENEKRELFTYTMSHDQQSQIKLRITILVAAIEIIKAITNER